MNKSEMIAKTVDAYLVQAEKNLKTIRAEITGAFDLGYDVSSSTMERLAEYQAAVKMYRNLAKLVARGVEKGDLDERVADRLEDMQEHLLMQGAGGSTSQMANGVTEMERKVMVRAYQTLSSLSKA